MLGTVSEASGFPLELFLEPLSFLWRAGVILVRAFGLLGLFVGSRCYFLYSLWLVWAVSGLGGCSRTVFLVDFLMFCYPGAWSRPRRRRGRRPHQLQESWSRFVLLVPFIFGHCVGFGWTMFLQGLSFKRASRSHAKTGLF